MEEEEMKKMVKNLPPEGRKKLWDELSKYPDPPGEEEFKGPFDGPESEALIK